MYSICRSFYSCSDRKPVIKRDKLWTRRNAMATLCRQVAARDTSYSSAKHEIKLIKLSGQLAAAKVCIGNVVSCRQ